MSNPGDLVAVGEIQNTGTQIVDNITVVGIAYDNNSQQLAQANSIVYGNDIAPGQKAPFYLDFFPINGQDQSWEASLANITIGVGSAVYTTDSQYAGLKTGSINVSNSSDAYTITGNVQNSGSQKPVTSG